MCRRENGIEIKCILIYSFSNKFDTPLSFYNLYFLLIFHRMFVWGCVTVALEDHYQPGFCNIVHYSGRSHFITTTYRTCVGKRAQNHCFLKLDVTWRYLWSATTYVMAYFLRLRYRELGCDASSMLFEILCHFVIWCLAAGSSIRPIKIV